MCPLAAQAPQGQEGERADLDDEAREVQEEPSRGVGRRPRGAPTPEQRRLHEEFHEPFRVWCRACVCGRAKAFLALTRESQEKEIPVIGVDYGYFRHADALEEDEDAAPEPDATPPGAHHALLCGRSSADRWAIGHLLPQKGDTVHGRMVLGGELMRSGYTRVVLRSDGEPAMVALRDAARLWATTQSRSFQDVLVETTRKAESKSNGLAEGAVREVKAKFRTIRYFVEERFHKKDPG